MRGKHVWPVFTSIHKKEVQQDGQNRSQHPSSIMTGWQCRQLVVNAK